MLKTLSELNRQRFALPLVLFCIVLATFNSSYAAVAPQRGARGGRMAQDKAPPARLKSKRYSRPLKMQLEQ